MALAGRTDRKESHPTLKAPSRVIIEAIHPSIDGGQFPIKRTVGEDVIVEADVFAEGHDVLKAVLKYRQVGASDWLETPMTPQPYNDRWTGRFVVETRGTLEYTVEGWIDRFASWHHELSRKAEAGQDVQSELLEGALLVFESARRASEADAAWLACRSELIASQTDQGRPRRFPVGTGPSRPPPIDCLTLPGWASTSFISRPFTRLDARSARGRTIA
jgi:starch synthase (maltosyl-transferring)